MSEKLHISNFWESLAEAIRLSAGRRGFWAYVPWFLILVVLTGAGVAYLLEIWRAPAVSTTDVIAALSAMIVVGGLLSAVSVACLSQIYATVGDPQFGDFLKEESVLQHFLFWPQFTLLIQVAFVLISAAAIVVCASVSDAIYRLSALIEVTSLLIYITTKTWQLLDLLRSLALYRQEYESLKLRFDQQRTLQNRSVVGR